MQFETGKPVRYGASIGQSLQTLRILDSSDEQILDVCCQRLRKGRADDIHQPFGLWTKCNLIFAEYFLRNWNERRTPLAFLLFDPPPALPQGALVFVHSEKRLRFLARFCESQYVSGQKFTVDPHERRAERERIWATYRAGTISAPTKNDFDEFWEKEHGVRGLFMMDRLEAVSVPCPSSKYTRALEWGYPKGVGYRYLSLAQSYLLLRGAGLPTETTARFAQQLVADSITTRLGT